MCEKLPTRTCAEHSVQFLRAAHFVSFGKEKGQRLCCNTFFCLGEGSYLRMRRTTCATFSIAFFYVEFFLWEEKKNYFSSSLSFSPFVQTSSSSSRYFLAACCSLESVAACCSLESVAAAAAAAAAGPQLFSLSLSLCK